MTTAYINRIATAVPAHDMHETFVDYARALLKDERKERIFDKMAEKSQISRRWSCQQPTPGNKHTIIDGESFLIEGNYPTTAKRMRVYEKQAFKLAQSAVENLGVAGIAQDITHIIITSCTGFSAPGLDLQLIKHFGLNPSLERTIVGFMGCYAAINGLKLAHHIVRSAPKSKVLLVSVELCTLHFQDTDDLEQILMFLLFADGCAAALISAEPDGLALTSFHAEVIPDTDALMSWHIRDMGFDMVLSGDVPRSVFRALKAGSERILGGLAPQDVSMWAVHPGGRTVLDAAEAAFTLPSTALKHSRDVLFEFGNMSSATVLFVLQRFLDEKRRGERGCAMSFGPGLTAETMLFAAPE